MTLVTGTVQDLGYDGMDGTLWARPARFRSDGSVVYAPERKPFKITGGVVSAELAPGPAVLELQVGSHARGTFEVVIPEEDTTLADLLDTVFPWEPAQVSLFVAEREAAEQAKADAETAAQVAEGHRQHVDDIRDLLDEAAQGNVAPYLTETALNATYVTVAEGVDTYVPRSELDALAAVLLEATGSQSRGAVETAIQDAPLTVRHGDNGAMLRPATDRPVMWIGAAVPSNRAAGDIVLSTSTGPQAWTPGLLDIVAWWDASALAIGSTVARVDGQQSRGVALTQVGGTGQWIVDDAAFGIPAFALDGSAWMTSEPLNGAWDAPVSVFMAVSLAGESNQTLFDRGSSGARPLIWRATSNRLGFLSTTDLTAANAFPDGPAILDATFTGGPGSTAGINGNQLLGPLTDQSSDITEIRIGASRGESNPVLGSIGEVIVARNVAPEDRQSVLDYLTEKWIS